MTDTPGYAGVLVVLAEMDEGPGVDAAGGVGNPFAVTDLAEPPEDCSHTPEV